MGAESGSGNRSAHQRAPAQAAYRVSSSKLRKNSASSRAATCRALLRRRRTMRPRSIVASQSGSPIKYLVIPRAHLPFG